MQTLERLFSTTQKERMLAAIPQRVSCRAFSAEPSLRIGRHWLTPPAGTPCPGRG